MGKHNTYVAYFLAAVLLKLVCRETGLDCDFVIEGETVEEILSKGADHAIEVHNLKGEEIFSEQTPCNFLCQIMSKLICTSHVHQNNL